MPSSTALLAGDKSSFTEWESTPYFDGCLPIEVMAERGRETLRYGPMKPVGLTNPHDPATKAYAVVQLRQDNKLGTLFNMVGFQTKLKHAEQVRVFRTIPGLRTRRVRAARRPAPQHLPQFAEAARRHAAAEGAAAAALRRPDHRLRGLCRVRRDRPARRPVRRRRAARRGVRAPPPTTAHGALLDHITGGHIETIDAGPPSFQPMNVNFGLFPPLAQSRRPRTRRQQAARPGQDRRQAARDHGPRAGRPGRRGSAATAALPRRKNRVRKPSRKPRRAARQSSHIRRHCGSSTLARTAGSRACPCVAPASPARSEAAPAKWRAAGGSSARRGEMWSARAAFGRARANLGSWLPAKMSSRPRAERSIRSAGRKSWPRAACQGNARSNRRWRTRCRHGRQSWTRIPAVGQDARRQAHQSRRRLRRIASRSRQARASARRRDRRARLDQLGSGAAAAVSLDDGRAPPPPDAPRRLPAPAASTSRHHCRRISPGIGSRASRAPGRFRG